MPVMNDNSRNVEIDILKGLSILAVVLGHSKFPGTHFIYLFHMAVFFMASGYFYKNKSSDTIGSVWTFIKKRIKGLWLPFVIWNAVYTLLTNVFIKLNIYTDNELLGEYVSAEYVSIHNHMSLTEMAKNIIKGIFMAGHTELGGAFWFLRVLFYISVAYVLIDYVLKKIFKTEKILFIMQGIISALFLTIGFLCHLYNIKTFAIDLFFSCYCLFFLGMMLGRLKLTFTKEYVYLLVLAVSTGILIVMNGFGTISLGNNEYVNPFYMLAASLAGWLMLYSLSFFLAKVSFLRKLFSLLGQNSIYIVIFHFLAFKVASCFIVLTKSYPSFAAAAFPVVTHEGLWWILYTVFGEGIPVLIGVIWNRCKRMLKKEESTNA